MKNKNHCYLLILFPMATYPLYIKKSWVTQWANIKLLYFDERVDKMKMDEGRVKLQKKTYKKNWGILKVYLVCSL